MVDKQKEILNAALKLFVEFGFHGTPTSKIAKEAGVANGTLFHYFKTKDELVVALYLSIKKEMAACSYEGLNQNIGFKEMFKQIVLQSMYWALYHPTEFRFVNQFYSSPFQSLVPADIVAEQSKGHREMIQKAIEAKVLKPIPVPLLFTVVGSHIYGIFQYLTSTELSQEKQKETIEQSFEMIWDMIR